MAEPNSTPSADVLLAALRNSRARLLEAATSLTAEQLRAQSYDTEWSIAQVLSHLGTGSIFFKFILEAGLAGEPVPGIDVMRPIWDQWNAKSPEDQARDGLEADGELIAAFEALDAQQRADWEIDMFGMHPDFAGIVQMRLSENSVHTWDIVVALDPKAQLLPDAVDLIIDTLETAGGTGRQATRPSTRRGGRDRRAGAQLRADCQCRGRIARTARRPI